MGCNAAEEKPHAVCIPYPAQGHINAMLKLAKLLHLKGFHITFVNTELNHKRLLKSRGPSSLMGFHGFGFETIPDDLQPFHEASTAPFRNLVNKLNDASSGTGTPRVSCIVSDGIMSFTLQVAEELRIPEAMFWPINACTIMCLLHYPQRVERGLVPLKDVSDLTNGYLDTPIDWIPGMKNIRMRDLPSYIRTTDPNDIMFNFLKHQVQRSSMASAIILNTFDELERPVLDAMSSMLPPIYTIGSISLVSRHIPKSQLTSIGSNMWKEELGCLEWLEGRDPSSVLYVSFGSVTVMTNQQLIEFAWGLANSNHDFLWVIRPGLVNGDSVVLPQDFLTETKGRCLLVSWCPQEQVLLHPSIGGFLTHSGWNSTMESISGGVPMICWPFLADQHTNCRYTCNEWGIGMEMNNNAKREEVEGLIREMMGGEKGKEMRRKASEWKEIAVRATEPGGSSFANLERVVKEVLAAPKKYLVS